MIAILVVSGRKLLRSENYLWVECYFQSIVILIKLGWLVRIYGLTTGPSMQLASLSSSITFKSIVIFNACYMYGIVQALTGFKRFLSSNSLQARGATMCLWHIVRQSMIRAQVFKERIVTYFKSDRGGKWRKVATTTIFYYNVNTYEKGRFLVM